jgi:uncharacterized protein YfaP (DUF2135 family)
LATISEINLEAANCDVDVGEAWGPELNQNGAFRRGEFLVTVEYIIGLVVACTTDLIARAVEWLDSSIDSLSGCCEHSEE